MSTEVVETGELKEETMEVDAAKRDFMKKFGKYAATAPLGMYLLMGPGASKAQASGTCSTQGSFHVQLCGGGTVSYTASGTVSQTSIAVNVNTWMYTDNWQITKFNDGTYTAQLGQFGTYNQSNTPSFFTTIIDDIFSALGC